MQGEIWKTTEPLKGFYEISSLGRIRRVAPGMGAVVGKILKTFQTKDGYLVVQINHPLRKRWTTGVHRLVCEAFHGPPSAGQHAHHKNADKLDNCVENLEWVSRTQNMRYCAATGVISEGQKRRLRDPQERVRRHTLNAKLTEQAARDIRTALRSGQTVQSVATMYGVHYQTIWSIKTGKSWVI